MTAIGSSVAGLASWLLCRAGSRLCAIPLENVVETMRLLPIEPVAGAPPAVLGLCSIRGAPVPVVSLKALLPGPGSPLQRMVTLRLNARIVAIAVEAVFGVRTFGGEESSLPPLLREAIGDTVAAIGMLDAEFLLFLRCARIAPVDLLDQLDLAGAAR